MTTTARLYLCALCRTQTFICSGCDRGNIYCSVSCSQSARSNSCKAANQRYQKTFKSRQKHAASQARYLARQKKVMDQGSPLPPPHDVLPLAIKTPLTCPVWCHFCGRACEVSVRRRFLRRRTPSQRVKAYRDP